MANKKTLKDYFNDIIALAEENGRDDLVEFAKGRIEVLNKKTENRKPSKTDEANAHLIEVVLETLAEVGKPVTVSELMKANEELGELSNQKVSALLRKIGEDKVVKTVDKKKSYFSLV